MDQKIKNKIDLLVGLAAVDNNVHVLERNIIQEVLKHYQVADYPIKPVFDNFKLLHEADKLEDKEELLYLALRIVLADTHQHPDEIAFVKVLAIKLGFKSSIIDYFSSQGLPAYNEYLTQLDKHRN